MRFFLQRKAQEPVRNPGRKALWNLPLEEMEVGDGLTLMMSYRLAKEKINAVRAYIARYQTVSARRYAVHLTKDGIYIWRKEDRKDDESPETGDQGGHAAADTDEGQEGNV